MAKPFDVLRLDEVEPIVVAGGLRWLPVRRALGVRAFGINAYTAAAAGDDVVESHTESSLGHEEVYVVLTGRATFTLDDATVDAPAGSIVVVRDPAVRRHARAEQPGTTVLAVGGAPGAAYTPSAWESYFAVERFRAAGDYAAALAELEEALETHPDNSGILYSLGCWSALAGREEEALAYVRRAVALDPRFDDWSRRDDDLIAIRDRLP
jgi:tetratricopeptide (TPR) repeat protein